MGAWRQEILIGLAALFVLGLVATAERILRARRHGYSVRLQVFVPLAALTLTLSASFALIVIQNVQARAALFARRAAEDEGRVVAQLLVRGLEAPGSNLEMAAREVPDQACVQLSMLTNAAATGSILGAVYMAVG